MLAGYVLNIYTIQHLCSYNICGKTLQYADDTNIYYHNRLNNLQPCIEPVNRDIGSHSFSRYAKIFEKIMFLTP